MTFLVQKRIFRTPSTPRSAGRVVSLPAVSNSKCSLMIWGCVYCITVGVLVRIEGIKKREDYLKILRKNAVTFGRRIIGHPLVFQQNNDSKHSFKL